MEMELISRETIKPSETTPPHLKIYPLSLIDNIAAPNSVPLVYFYPNEIHESETNNSPNQVCDQTLIQILKLKKSLSQVLSIYYPLAGRLNDKKLCIDCNDQGVSLLVTRIINCSLSAVLHNPNEAFLNPLFPDELQWKDMGSDASLLAIQINFFACGGIAISVCMSHKVGDVSTLFNFINDWATLNRRKSSEEEEGELINIPSIHDGGSSSLFPQGDLPVFPAFKFVAHNNTSCRRFVFEGSKVESLKEAMVSSSHKERGQKYGTGDFYLKNPTRVEIATALIYKCAVSALKLTAESTSMLIAVNLRKRMIPSLPDKSLGNLVWSFRVSGQLLINNQKEVELHELVIKMREGLSEFCDKNVKNFGDLSFVCEFLRQATLRRTKQADSSSSRGQYEKQNLLIFVSWCKLSMYEADFGWGKPIWVTTSGCRMRNTVVLMDTRDGNGIEAVVNMEEKDMAMFECHVELLQYASFNPNRWTNADP